MNLLPQVVDYSSDSRSAPPPLLKLQLTQNDNSGNDDGESDVDTTQVNCGNEKSNIVIESTNESGSTVVQYFHT